MARQDGNLGGYLERVRKIPTLDREAEHVLAVKARDGDQAAIDKLVESNLRFVVAVALKYRRYGIPLSELLAEGNLGLMMAAKKFDPDRGTRFVTYAGYWIRAYVLDLVVKSTTMVGAGSGPLRSKLFFRLRRERAKVANLTSDPHERLEMMAERFDTTPEKMEKMLRRLDSRDVSLSAPLFDDSGSTLQDALPYEGQGQEEHLLGTERQRFLEEHLSEALDTLDSRERYIMEQRYMQDDTVSLAALGRELGVSRERARQLEARAKKKLQKRLSQVDLEAVA